MTEKETRSDIAATYIRENFEPQDRVAIVLLDKRKSTARQRIGSVERVSSPEYQAWLHRQNDNGCDVYISMNALRADAKGRTKIDIATIRHIYLDFDENGTAAVADLLKRADLPQPNYVINTSPSKWQVIWKAERFPKEKAENLQRNLAAQT